MLINKENEQTKNNETVKNQILNFINDKDKYETKINDEYLLIKHLYKDNVFIYLKNIYFDTIRTLKGKYEYQGFYNLALNQFYDLGYRLSDLISLSDSLSFEKLKMQLIEGIKEKISEELKTNHQKYFKDNIQLNENLNNQVEEWRKCQAISEAQRDFFGNKRKSLSDFIIRLNFKINGIKEIEIDEILNFIQTPETVLNYYKDEFLNKCIEDLYFDFNKYVIYKNYISEIEKDKSNILHKQKFLKEAIQNKKSVIVTILKDGKEFTFKTITKPFLRLSSGYSKYDIQAKDRKKYEELFKYKDYLFDEIISIKYGKKELYSKKRTGRKICTEI